MADVALDDYIKTNRITRSGPRTNVTNGGRGGGRQIRGIHGPLQQAGNAGLSGGITKNTRRRSWGGVSQFARPGRWMYTRSGPDGMEAPGSRVGTKIIISNLFYGVSESDIRDLFSEMGSMLKCTMNYDSSGRSLGTAEIVYQRAGDAWAAMDKYNGVPLDGRAMEIQLVRARDRLDAFPQRRRYATQGGPAAGWSNRPRSGRPLAADVGGGPSRRAGARGVGTARTVKPEVTLEQLNMELDEFVLS